jgi:hypothetical protein
MEEILSPFRDVFSTLGTHHFQPLWTNSKYHGFATKSLQIKLKNKHTKFVAPSQPLLTSSVRNHFKCSHA